MVKKSNGWNLKEMQETLVKDTEQRISDGFQEIASGQQDDSHSTVYTVKPTMEPPVPPVKEEQPKEPTKGVQTYIPMSMYRRLNDIKLTRRENISALVAQAIALWLDVQGGKVRVENSKSVTL
jgi:hypothetical protein